MERASDAASDDEENGAGDDGANAALERAQTQAKTTDYGTFGLERSSRGIFVFFSERDARSDPIHHRRSGECSDEEPAAETDVSASALSCSRRR